MSDRPEPEPLRQWCKVCQRFTVSTTSTYDDDVICAEHDQDDDCWDN